MHLKVSLPAIFVIGFFIIGTAILASRFMSPPEKAPTIAVKVPTLTQFALRGKDSFSKNCAVCHGENAAGTQKGPPLVHDIYNPGHHADGAFLLATRRGVRQHHWPFGNMPPQAHVTDAEVKAITRYVRELQAANGIFYRPHRM